MKRTGPTNIHLRNLIVDLKILANKEKAPVWRKVAKELEKSARRRPTVNLFKVEKYCKDGEIAVIPGKLLSEGTLTKKVQIAAYSFSQKAKEKTKTLTIRQLIKENPKGKKVRVLI
ncbi:MAG: 50S ribosomal protein L18e [Candidatus Nanoarchaeia archaeon]|nr:50S ribosomal protein L18e [Candidatus Nanoarchaeia archaeon]